MADNGDFLEIVAMAEEKVRITPLLAAFPTGEVLQQDKKLNSSGTCDLLHELGFHGIELGFLQLATYAEKKKAVIMQFENGTHLIWLAFGLLKEHSLGCGHEQRSDDGENEYRHCKNGGREPHARLFKLPRRASEEEHGGEEHGVGEKLPGTISRFARLDEPLHRIGPRRRRVRGAADLVKIRHEWVRISGAILEWLLRKPCVAGLLHVRRKPLGIKAREPFVTGLLRGEELHEHRGVDDQRLAAPHLEQRRLPFQRIVFVEQPVGSPGPG